MGDPRFARLMAVDQGLLVQALLELADSVPLAQEMVAQLLASGDEKVQMFRQKLAQLKTGNYFFSWRETDNFISELRMLLQLIEPAVDESWAALRLVLEFFQADGAMVESCDDSSGHLSSVFSEAAEMFVGYAQACADKSAVMDAVIDLCREDDYGLRFAVIERTQEWLPPELMSSFAQRWYQLGEQGAEDSESSQCFSVVQSLAEQLKDADLFAAAYRAKWGELSTAAKVDIARIYVRREEPDAALTWLSKIADEETFLGLERQQLLIDIYRLQGQGERLVELLEHRLREHRSIERLEELLTEIGSDRRQEIVAREVQSILSSGQWVEMNLDFLIEVKAFAEAEAYVIAHQEELDGGGYYVLVPAAQALSAAGGYVAATLIYRALLISILDRGFSRAYHHAVDYASQLEGMANAIAGHETIIDHDQFIALLRDKHGRKRSFWHQYNNRK